VSWPLVKLGDICDLFNGYAFKSTDYVDESNTLSCRMSNIRPGGKFDIEYNARYLPDSFVEKYKQFLLKDGDVVIAMTDLADSPKILGVPTIIKTDGRDILLNQRVGKLIIKEQNKVYFPYLQIALNSLKVRSVYKRFAGGGLQINLGKEDLFSVEIPLPSLPEQQKIASILDAADNLRQKDQQLIEKYTALSQSLFLEMFGDPANNTSKYEVVSLKKVTCKITDGVHAKPEYTDKGIPFISVKDITSGSLFFEKCKYISHEAHCGYFKRCNPEFGDTLYTKVGATYGRSAIVDVEFPFSLYVSVALIKPDKNLINSFYLKEVMASSSIKKQADKAIKGIGVPDLHLNMIKEFKIPLPPISLQKQFAERIQEIEAQKQLALASLEKSEALFNSLLQRAFKGELTV
jgi:type I restriction enzyme S subunit